MREDPEQSSFCFSQFISVLMAVYEPRRVTVNRNFINFAFNGGSGKAKNSKTYMIMLALPDLITRIKAYDYSLTSFEADAVAYAH